MIDPLVRYALIAAAVLAAVAAVIFGIQRHDRQMVDQGRREVQQVIDKAAADNRVQRQRTIDIQAGARADAQRHQYLEDAQRADADAAVRSLQLAAAGVRAARPTPAASGASSAGGVPATDVVPGDLYRDVVARAASLGASAAELSRYADCLERTGTECARDYQALIPENHGQ